MKDTISATAIEQMWQRIVQAPASEAQLLVHQMREEQPVIFRYLLSLESEEYSFNAQEKHVVRSIALIIWQILKTSKYCLHPVTENKLEVAKVNLYKALRAAPNNKQGFRNTFEELFCVHGESELFRYMVVAIFRNNGRFSPIRNEHQLMAFLYLKIIFDAFVASLEGYTGFRNRQWKHLA